jgi:hypothetical protein
MEKTELDLIYILGENCIEHLHGDDLRLYQALPEELMLCRSGDVASSDGYIWHIAPLPAPAVVGLVPWGCLIGLIAKVGLAIVNPVDVDFVSGDFAFAA